MAFKLRYRLVEVLEGLLWVLSGEAGVRDGEAGWEVPAEMQVVCAWLWHPGWPGAAAGDGWMVK